MRHWFNKSVAAAFAAILFLLGAEVAVCEDDLKELGARIDSWHLEEARILADGLKGEIEDTPEYKYLLGRLLFHEGDYRGALEHLRLAIEGARAELGWKLLRDTCERTQRAFEPLVEEAGKTGSFLYRYKKGNDAVLIPYAEEVLNTQLEALDKILGDRPKYTVEIVILPDIESLAAASGLSVDQIERTGTVGVTKYARIMIMSPGTLSTGYPWLDTLAHELTHLIITRVSQNRAPIWIQEGIAKLYERAWKNGETGSLTPEEAYLLDRAAKERRLIPLRRFHPSVAHLPNQEDAALAYAQVLSFSRYLSGKLGSDWTRSLLTGMGEGKSLDEAFAVLSKFNVRRLYNWWRQEVSGKRQTPVPAVRLLERRYLRGEATGEKGLEAALEVDVRRHLRVGDLLRLRGHTSAAIKEYRQAEHLAGSPSPKISDRLGACLLKTGKSKEALELLSEMADLYPSHSTLFVQLGQAHAMEKETTSAVDAFNRANGINPFDPTIHCYLKDLYKSEGKTEEAEFEADHCLRLSGNQDE